MGQLHQWVTTVDHKRLGVLYILYALLFLMIGGVEATIMRIQLIRPLNHFVSPQVFNRMFTMHGTTMIFFVIMPVMFGFSNYLIPLIIGARDMAFPRLNAFSFWLMAQSCRWVQPGPDLRSHLFSCGNRLRSPPRPS